VCFKFFLNGKIEKISVVDTGVYYPSISISDSTTPSFVNVTIDSPNKILQGNVSFTGRAGTFTSNVYHYLHKNESINLNYYGKKNQEIRVM
jgi:hypothetical protein